MTVLSTTDSRLATTPAPLLPRTHRRRGVALATSHSLEARLLNVLAVAVLFVVFMVTYRTLVASQYEYYGMGWRDPSLGLVVTTFAMNLSLAFLANPVYRRPSQLFLVAQFLIVFLPASIVCLNVLQPELSEAETFPMIVVMYAGMLFQTLFSEGKAHAGQRGTVGWIRQRSLVIGLLAFTALTLAFTGYLLGDIFTLTDLESMYEQRDVLDDRAAPAFLRYAISWLVAFILPALFVFAARASGRRRVAFLATWLLGYFVLFGITATKTTLFAPLIIGAIYWALKKRRASFLCAFAYGIALLLALPLAMAAVESLQLSTTLYVSIVNFRTFSVPQTLYVQYLDFFHSHPLTLGSHISVISWFVGYPFDSPVYLLVGDYFYPGSNMTANSGMWGQDGIAGFGLVGIFLVSILLTGVMRLLDFAAAGHDTRLVSTALAMLALFISNISLFTTLISGGLAIAIFLLYATRRAGAPPRRRSRRRALPALSNATAEATR